MRWKNTLPRRDFLKVSAFASGSLFFPGLLLGQGPKKLQFGGIGVEGKGKMDVAKAAEGAEIVALCDVDRTRLQRAKTVYPNARIFEDFREMFQAMGDQLDGVTVSTPDHAHFPAAMEAIKHGKHVCVQKPLTNRVWEANQLLEASRKRRVLTNMGNQGHLNEGIRFLKEWLVQGVIGRVREIHVWTNRPIWPQGRRAADAMVATAAPDFLNWEAWLAQCPAVEYVPGLHPFSWRCHREYGAGAMGDMGCHLLDGPFWACELGDPYRVEADVEDTAGQTFPGASTIQCLFKTSLFGEVKLVWYDGGRKPERPVELDPNMDWDKMKGGCLYLGEEGKLLCAGDNSSNPRILPAARHDAWIADKKPSRFLERATVNTPQLELVRAIEANKPCGANFEYSVPLTRLGLIGNIAALLPGQSLEWLTTEQHFKNHAAANAMLRRATVRKGWEYFADQI
jgi:predicted dehydrogenase